jgi:pyridinium-3,5-biscarboxylic acid mononucleotide sulfurtransferase
VSDRAGRLVERIAQESALVIGFSGGVDSALVAAVAHQVLGSRAVAVTAVSASLPARERRAAREFAAGRGIAHVEVCTDELDRPQYVRNGASRCAHCKSALLDALMPLAAAVGGRVALGVNVDDLGEFRPGQQVARQRGAIFPLADAGLSKADVRAVSRELGLSTADKPAAACLSSRVAYGDQVTPEVLRQVETAEDALHDAGFADCRVRAHASGTVARVEVPEADLARLLARRRQISDLILAAGFRFATVDLLGFRSGSMNVLLRLEPARAGG